jgi:hypothetical protein
VKRKTVKQRWIFVACAILILLLPLAACANNVQEKASNSNDTPFSTDVFTETGLSKETAKQPSIEYEVPYDKLFATPKSTCFSEIGYDPNNELLIVRFRDSGKAYLYLSFPSQEWDTFKSAKSLGSYYNSEIKGHYKSIKVEE